MTDATITGIHHIKFPVSDLTSSIAWYRRVLGFEVEIEFPDQDGTVRGVADRVAAEAWTGKLDELGIEHSPVIDATIGWIVRFHDPDGIEIRLYSFAAHGIDQSSRAGYGRPVRTKVW